MYDSKMISDLQNRFPQAKGVQLMQDEEFITTLAFNLPYFRAIDKKLRLTAAVYASQYVKDQADVFGTTITVVPFKKRLNWWLVGGVGAAVLGCWKLFSSTRDAVVNVMPQVVSAGVGATPIGAAGTIANKAAALVPETAEKRLSTEVIEKDNGLDGLLELAMQGVTSENK